MTQAKTAVATILLLAILSPAKDPAPPKQNAEGVLPVGADGKPLNLDFETGTLKDWTVEGKAFEGQPMKGDTVNPRRGDMKSQHQGSYWIGTFERDGDKPQGTLTSVAFKVTHLWASFLIGGGPWPETCVEIVLKEGQAKQPLTPDPSPLPQGRGEKKEKVIFRASGIEEENLRRVVVDLKPHIGKEIFVRLVDKHSGHWGHINFDDFRFHAERPDFPPRPKHGAAAPPDTYKYAGLPPEKAARVMTVPEGFEVKLFAGEPDVRQPIALCLDDRGRVWVAEGHTYPRRHPHPGVLLPEKDKAKGDRILIFEDTDGDGKFDKRTVFMEGLNLVSGLEVGFGGVWIGAALYFLFVPVKEGEDQPAGEPKILLDGWGYQDTHETLNAFTWGPDGWLYGCHGVFTHSRVGKPDTPDEDRVPLNAGIWRYHPTRHVFEVFAHGTSNPWGLDFNDHGQAFCEACVIPHAFHIIQGARYERQAGEHFNKHTYADIKTIADHLHWKGKNQWESSGSSGSMGGGHAHCGLMCYLGGAWPKEYHGQLFMGNIHGRRLNMDTLRAKGSGYVASHGPDFLLANDAFARFINMRYGPDGNVFLIDWYDKQACHSGDVKIWDRDSGRIYKICYRGTKPVHPDLQKLDDLVLADLQLNDNEWWVRHGRRVLQERSAGRKLSADAVKALTKITFEHKEGSRRLRGLWSMHATGLLTRGGIAKSLADKSAPVRAWTIQLALENRRKELVSMDQLIALADQDESPLVRLYLASALQRLDFDERERLLAHLLAWDEDAGDANLPLLCWYGLEPLAGNADHRRAALKLALGGRMPQIVNFTARRIAADAAADANQVLKIMQILVDALASTGDEQTQIALLRGINEGLKGRRKVAMPKAWPSVFGQLAKSANAELRSQAIALAVTFGDASAFTEMRELVGNPKADLALRQEALASLLGAKDAQLPPVLRGLLAEPALRGPALRGLATYDDSDTPAAILKIYPQCSSPEKRDALSTLASRARYAQALLTAIADKKVAAGDVSADIVRQMRNLQDGEVSKRIGEVWGTVRDTPADRARLIAQHREMLSKPAKTPPDANLGRAIFAKTCAQCHALLGVGGKVGPELTGANRGSLDYLLENIIDPGAIVPKEYEAAVIELKDGRSITGIIRGRSDVALTVLTANETLTLPLKEIDKQKPSSVSMMPDDALNALKEHEIRALIAYLQSPSQVPMLATPDNALDFFNGKDLSGWDGDPKLWKVEKGEIVGRSPGLKKNEFLISHMLAGDFRLKLRVKLVPDTGNSGVQFRSEALPNGEVKGLQADIGAGWWGKLYDEHGRGVLWDKSGEDHVKPGDWNDYEIVADGPRIRTYINGKLCVDYEDKTGPRRGIFALQLHSGEAMEVRFREIRLEAAPKLPERKR